MTKDGDPCDGQMRTSLQGSSYIQGACITARAVRTRDSWMPLQQTHRAATRRELENSVVLPS